MGNIFSPSKPTASGPDPSLTAQLAEREAQLNEQKAENERAEEQRKRQLRGGRSLLTAGYAGFSDTKDTLG